MSLAYAAIAATMAITGTRVALDAFLVIAIFKALQARHVTRLVIAPVESGPEWEVENAISACQATTVLAMDGMIIMISFMISSDMTQIYLKQTTFNGCY